MKVALLFLFAGVGSIVASDVIWMELMSARIVEALDDKAVTVNKTIPEVADDLGLKILLKLVEKANLTDALSGSGEIMFSVLQCFNITRYFTMVGRFCI